MFQMKWINWGTRGGCLWVANFKMGGSNWPAVLAYPYELEGTFAPLQTNDKLETKGDLIGGVINPPLTLFFLYTSWTSANWCFHSEMWWTWSVRDWIWEGFPLRSYSIHGRAFQFVSMSVNPIIMSILHEWRSYLDSSMVLHQPRLSIPRRAVPSRAQQGVLAASCARFGISQLRLRPGRRFTGFFRCQVRTMQTQEAWTKRYTSCVNTAERY